MAEHDVAADVPGEPCVVCERVAEPSDVGVSVDEVEVCVSELFESVCGAESCWSAADDEDSAWVGFFVGHVFVSCLAGIVWFLFG